MAESVGFSALPKNTTLGSSGNLLNLSGTEEKEFSFIGIDKYMVLIAPLSYTVKVLFELFNGSIKLNERKLHE